MRNTETLIIEARNIMSKELRTCKGEITYNSIAGKRLRRVFISNCLSEIDEPFIKSIESSNRIDSIQRA